MTNQAAVRVFSGALLVMGLVILLDQLTILLTSVYPPNAGAVQWRFGAVGLGIGRMTPLLFADALLIGGAVLAGWTGVLRLLGALHILLAVVLLAAIGFFTLDALEVRARVALAQQTGFTVGAGRTAVVGVAAGLLLLWVGIRLLIFRDDVTGAGRGSRASGMLVVGQEEGEQA